MSNLRLRKKGVVEDLNAFLEIFGDLKVATVVLVITAVIFLWKVFKAVENYYHKKWEVEKEKEKQTKDILEQVQNYPKWHQQSIDIRDKFSETIASLEAKIDSMNDLIIGLKTSSSEGMAYTWRYRILRFDDEIRHDEKHTKEHFDQILEDITKYEKYCRAHPDFPNNKAVLAIKNIKDVYRKCTDESSFL